MLAGDAHALIAPMAEHPGGMVFVQIAAAIHGEDGAFGKARIRRSGERMRVVVTEKLGLCLRESFAAQEFLPPEVRLELLAAQAQALDEVGEQHLRPRA